MQPTVGRIVEYQMKNRLGQQVVRPAMIVAVWQNELVNLQVFLDGHNDNEYGVPLKWATSVRHSEAKEPYTWDWMDFQKGQAKKTEELEGKLKTQNEGVPSDWGTGNH